MPLPALPLAQKSVGPDLNQSESDSYLQAGVNTKQRLRLLTYNIQAGIATTKYRHYVTHSWKHILPYPERLRNLERIAGLVSDYDLVALQEVDAGSLRSGFINITEYLAFKARFPHWYNQTNRDLGKLARHGIGFLSKLRCDDVSEHRLPGIVPGRGAMVLRFGSGSDALVIVIMHLALGRRARLRQLAFISELVNEYEHVILMGDLNCGSNSMEMDLLMSNTSLREPVHGLHTFPSWRPLRNLDHILVSDSLQVEEVKVLDYPFSDHLPVSMIVSLPMAFDSA